MLRAIAGLLFIIMSFSVTSLLVLLVIKTTGTGGLLAMIVGLPVFIGGLSLSVLILERINSRINDKAQQIESSRKSLH
jgi:hypothetical protein